MSSTRELRVLILGDSSSLENTFGSIATKVEGLAGKFGPLGTAAAAGVAAVGGAAIGAGVALFKIGENFDEAYDHIRVGTGKTGEDLDQLKGVFKDVVRDVPTDFGKASDAITQLTQRTGAAPAQVKPLAEQLLELSRITKTDLTENIKSSQDAFNAWGVDVGKQPAMLDELFRASQQTGVAVGTIASSIAGAEPQLKSLGFNFESSAALAATLGKAGLDLSDVMPAMGKAMAKAAKDGVDAKTLFQETFDSIKKAPNDTAAAGIALDVFGAKAGPKLAEMIREGNLSFSDLLHTMQTGKDTITGAGRDTADFAEKWEMFKNRVLVALEPIALRVFNGMGAAMDRLGPIFSRIGTAVSAFFAAFRGEGVTSDGFVGAMERIGVAVRHVVDVVGGAIDAVVGIFHHGGDSTNATASQISGILHQLEEVFRAVFDAIRGIVSVAVDIITGLWQRFGEHLLEHLRVAFDAILQVVRGVLEVIRGVFDIFAGIFTGDWGRVWNGVKEIFGGVWNIIVGLLRDVLNTISTVIGAAMAVLSGLWSAAWNGVKNAAVGIWNGIKDFIGGSIHAVVGFVEGMPGAISRAASGMWDGIKNAFRDAINWIIRAWNSLHFHIPGFHVGPIGYDGFDLGVPHIPLLAAGGVAMRPTLAMIAEAGEPEAVAPLSSLRSMIQDAVASARGGGTQTVIVELDGREIAKATLPYTRTEVIRMRSRGTKAGFAPGV